MENEKTSRVSYAIFGFALVIVLVNLISIVFPSLMAALILGSESDMNPFEMSAWTFPLITVNLFFLSFGILHYKKILPSKIRNSLKFILNFEVSRNVAILVVVMIIFGYIGYTMKDLSMDEALVWGDFKRVKATAENWPASEGVDETLYSLHVKNFFLKTSLVLFQNISIMPFIASVALLLLTYFFTLEISKKRFAGIVAMIIVFQSHTFLQFDTLATYSNFWVLFYLLSLYLICKKWYLSPIAFIASIFSKPLTAAFLPFTLFFIYRTDLPRRKKIYAIISYAIIILIGTVGILITGTDFGGGITEGRFSFNIVELLGGLTTWGFQLRLDGLFLVFVLPLTVGLFLTSRRGIKQADSILFLIVGIVLVMPLMAAFTSFNIHPYRYVPLIVFFAIGVGTLLSQKIKPPV